MYEVVDVVQRIKNSARQKDIKISDMLISCDLSKNALSSMNSRGSWIQANSLAKIADYLDVSVDYLLGRTENPNINNNGTSISQKYIGGDANASITNHSETKTTDSDSDDTISELVAVFKTLDFCDKAKVMSLIAELSTK